jgi:putative NADH-flavin reductase
MNIAIFGANGGTGRLLTERSLAAGHKVSALLRTPEAFPYRDRVQVIQGSAFDPDPVRRTLEGTDAVLSALGPRSPLRNENVLPRAVPIIVEAMQQTGIRRIIVLGAAATLPDAMSKQSALNRWIAENIIYKTFLKWPIAEQIAQYKALAASNLDWTIVMPPRLTNTPGRHPYRIDGEALPPNGSRISRHDVADFMMQQLTSPEWLRKSVYISL